MPGPWEGVVDPIVRDFYAREVLRQAQIGSTPGEGLRVDFNWPGSRTTRIWGHLHAFPGCGRRDPYRACSGRRPGASSLPARREQAVNRGRGLRELLAAADDSPLATGDDLDPRRVRARSGDGSARRAVCAPSVARSGRAPQLCMRTDELGDRPADLSHIIAPWLHDQTQRACQRLLAPDDMDRSRRT